MMKTIAKLLSPKIRSVGDKKLGAMPKKGVKAATLNNEVHRKKLIKNKGK